MADARLTDLEIRLTHQESTLEALNNVIADQQRLIDRLYKEVDLLQRQMREMSPANIAAPWEETPPPHF